MENIIKNFNIMHAVVLFELSYCDTVHYNMTGYFKHCYDYTE